MKQPEMRTEVPEGCSEIKDKERKKTPTSSSGRLNLKVFKLRYVAEIMMDRRKPGSYRRMPFGISAETLDSSGSSLNNSARQELAMSTGIPNYPKINFWEINQGLNSLICEVEEWQRS